MASFVYDALPVRVVFGPGAARTRLAGEVERLGVATILAVGSSRYEQLFAPLPVAARFTQVKEHVPVATAEAARAAAAGCDGVVAIGGGSAVGAAKAVALTARIPILAVPTTYAGSEVTPIWGLTQGDRKTTGVDLAVLPRTVVYDPELVASLPPELATASAFNAMAHGVEALWAPGRNPVSTVIATEGIAALAAGLRSGDAAELLRGAWLAASAFAVTGSGLHHKLCHVLGGMGLPHARTHAVVLPHVLAFNAPGAPDAAARVAGAVGGSPADLAAAHGVPSGLRALGLREDQLAAVVALTEPLVPPDNPVPVGNGALARLVRAAWEEKS